MRQTGFKKEVIEYLLEHPELFDKPESNSLLYKKFKADTPSKKSKIRAVKSEALKKYKQSKNVKTPAKKSPKQPINQNNLPALPDDFIKLWQADKDILKAMIAKYKQNESIDFILSEQNFEPEKPFKTFSYSLSEGLHKSFEVICRKLKISKRKGIHLALKGFIDFYNRK